ncbi:MAG TPA: hypothetical protein PKM22_10760, partial [Candidatus Hydrogenedentes bacterium]|nr:hypothetical protein [Candidatus Hydrogenedentota bacterium]
RIDVADGQGANWGSPRTPHASYSTVGGGLEMMRAIRDGIAQGPASRPVLIPESPFRREYFGVTGAHVVGYGFEFVNFIRDHTDLALDAPARMAARLHAFFGAEQGAMPPGALVIRTLNNHDTVVERGRVQNRFGAGLARALYGVCLAAPGLPMMYQEEETGSFEALRAMNWTRRLLPELGAGEAEFLPPGYFAPEVFAVMRRDARRQTLILVNLSGKPVAGRAVMPGGVPDETTVYDAAAVVAPRDGIGVRCRRRGGPQGRHGRPADRARARPRRGLGPETLRNGLSAHRCAAGRTRAGPAIHAPRRERIPSSRNARLAGPSRGADVAMRRRRSHLERPRRGLGNPE